VDVDCSPSESAAKPSLHRERQAAKLLSVDESRAAGDNVEAGIWKDALQAEVPMLGYQKKSIYESSQTLLMAGSPENDLFRRHKEALTGNGTIQRKSSDKPSQ
jgi:hypothetical protein